MEDLRQTLLQRRIAGEIGEDEYRQLLSEIERHDSARGDTATPAAQDTNSDGSPGYASMGGWVTGAGPVGHLAAGESIDTFALIDRLGRGGMGEVWRARDTVGERDVVLKVLPAELVANAEEMHRIKSSFAKVHALNHQHICPTYALGQHDRVGYFLVMKFLDGQTLAGFRREYVARHQTFPLDQVVRVLRPIAQALDYAHRAKVIHRDVKPENIMIVGEEQEPYLIDFGLAAEVRTSLARATRVQMDNSGTYPYMAPEQWRAQPQDAHTDQYALGVVVYELLAGRLPFESVDAAILMRAALEEEAAPVAGLAVSTQQAIARALAKSPAARFDTCGQFVDALMSDGQSSEPPHSGPTIVDAQIVAPEGQLITGNAAVPSQPAGQPPPGSHPPNHTPHGYPATSGTPASPQVAYGQQPAAPVIDVDNQVGRLAGSSWGNLYVRYNNHVVRIHHGPVRVGIYYDGRKKGSTLFGRKVEFKVVENGEQATYEIAVSSPLKFSRSTVRRNGQTLVENI